MLKYLAILAVLISVTNATIPVSGQTANNGTDDNGHASKRADNGESPAKNLPISTIQKEDGQSLASKTDEGSENHNQSSVSITNSTPMPVSWSLPNWATWIGWGANLVLTGFLVWGVIVAMSSLRALEEQTKETGRSAKATEDSVKATKDAYSIARDTSERELRAYLMVSDARLFLYEDGWIEPRLTFSNSGKTPAYNLRGHQHLSLGDPMKTNPSDSMLLRYGTVGKKYRLTGPKENVASTKQQVINYLASGEMQIFLQGWFKYRDAFGKTQPFDYRLVIGQGALSRGHDTEHDWLVFFDDQMEMPGDYDQDQQQPPKPN